MAARDGPGGRATLSGAVGPIHHSGSTARDDPPQWITQRYAYPRPRQSRETGISVVRPAKGYTEGRRTALIHSLRVERAACRDEPLQWNISARQGVERKKEFYSQSERILQQNSLAQHWARGVLSKKEKK